MYVDDDTPLIEGCRRGDAASHKKLYAKYSGKVYGFARRFLGDEQHAEDVTQEVFLRVFRKLSTFRGDARFSTMSWTPCGRDGPVFCSVGDMCRQPGRGLGDAA